MRHLIRRFFQLIPCWGLTISTIILSTPQALGTPTASLRSHPDLAELPEQWGRLTESFEVPGAAVFVVDGGKIFTTTFGTRDPVSGEPVTPETMFYIASISKTITATGICALADEGALSLDDLVKDHLPRFRHPDKELFDSLTLRDLLCHRRGMISPPVGILSAYSGEITDERFYYWVNQVPIVRGEPSYNNLHYMLLGRVTEQVTGMSWREYLDRAVLQQAGMTRTTAYASRLYGDPNAAHPARRTPGGYTRMTQVKTDRTMHAAGGHGMSAIDAGRWMLLHLNDGVIDGARVLEPETSSAMRVIEAELSQPRRMTGTIRGYGHAWQIGELMGLPTFAHGGGYEGAYAYFIACPEENVAVGVLTNGGLNSAYWADGVICDVIERLTDAEGAEKQWELSRRTVEERKAERAGEDPAADEPRVLSSRSLSRPIGLYSGWYRNEHMGTIIVTLTDGGLAFALGDLAMGANPGASIDGFVLERAGPGAFILDSTGSVNGVRLNHPMLGEVDFLR